MSSGRLLGYEVSSFKILSFVKAHEAEGSRGLQDSSTNLQEIATHLAFFLPHVHPKEGYFLLSVIENKGHRMKSCFASCADNHVSV